MKSNSFKLLVEKGHLESGTKRQQDAHEFLMHLLKLCQQNSRTDLVRSTGSVVSKIVSSTRTGTSSVCRCQYHDTWL